MPLPSRRHLAGALLATALAAGSACTASDAGADRAPSSGPPVPSASVTAASGPGPLRFPDRGWVCMERQGDRDFVDAGTTYRPRADVTIRAATLVAAQNVWLANAVVVPNPKVPIGAYLRGWPQPARVLHRDFPRWAERRPLVGATLRAGTSYAVLLHVRAVGRRTEGGYRAVRLRYDADGTRYRTELPVELRLRRSC